MNCLEIDNVELNFGIKETLKAVYFKAEKGKITGMLGRNGSGKTSLLRIIFGELKPNNKLIRIDNKPFLSPLYKRGIINYLPQFNIVPNSVSLKSAFNYYSVSIDTFLIHFPSFKTYVNKPFSKLSGGEKRVIETYLVLKSPTKITLLDEPFSHIAPIYIQKIKEVIEQTKNQKIIIITDHLYKDILDISDVIYMLKDGWCKQITTNDELIRFKYINSL